MACQVLVKVKRIEALAKAGLESSPTSSADVEGNVDAGSSGGIGSLSEIVHSTSSLICVASTLCIGLNGSRSPPS